MGDKMSITNDTIEYFKSNFAIKLDVGGVSMKDDAIVITAQLTFEGQVISEDCIRLDFKHCDVTYDGTKFAKYLLHQGEKQI